MNKQISSDLAKHKKIIMSLVAYANHPKLDTLIYKLAPNLPSSKRFLIKMEIKRLARPCNIIMDFRPMFDQCEPVEHNNICHYLDQISKTLFFESLEKNNNLYSVVTYQELTKRAEKRYLAQKSEQNSQNAEFDDNINQDITTAISLINRNFNHQEAPNYHPQCKAFSYDPLGMSNNGKLNIGITAKIIDLNASNCIVKTSQQLKTENNQLFLWFFNHASELKFTTEIVLSFAVVEHQALNNGHSHHYQLRLAAGSRPDMVAALNKLLQQRLLAQKIFYKSLVPPLMDSVIAKSHEQYLTARVRDIPMMCAKYKTGWRPSSALFTGANHCLWDFLTINDDDFSPLARLFSHSDIQTAIERDDAFDDYAYLLKHQYGQNVQYAIVWQNQLNNDPLAQQFVKKHVLSGNYRYIRLKIAAINALQDAYVPSAVASSVNPAIALMNRPLSQQTASSLKVASHFAVLSDVTELNNTLALPKVFGVLADVSSPSAPLKCPQQFRLAQLERRSPMEKVSLDLNDARREDRFDYQLPIEVTRCGKHPTSISGCTTNISSRGLAITLDKELKFKPGDELKLTLILPSSSGQQQLHEQTYQILGGDGYQLRLVISGMESRHQACQQLRQLIYQNLDSMVANGLSHGQTYGLSQAIRNIYASNHFSVPFFIHQDKRQWYINSLAMNSHSAFPSLVTTKTTLQETLLRLVNQKTFRDYCLLTLNKVDEANPHQIFYMLALPQESAADANKLFWFSDLKQLTLSGKLIDVMKKVQSKGKPTIIRVQLTKPQGIVAKGFIDELRYLKQISPNKAAELVATIEQVAGIGEITDHTEQVMALFQHYIAPAPRSSLKIAS